MRIHLAVFAVLALVAAGCGSDDSDSAAKTEKAPPPAPTKAEYIATGDAACAKTANATKPLVRALSRSLKAENAAFAAGRSIEAELRRQGKLYGRLVGVRRELTAELEAIEPPKSGPPEAYLRARKASTAATAKLSRVLTKSAGLPTQAALKAQAAGAKGATTASKRSSRAASAYGYKRCERQVKIG